MNGQEFAVIRDMYRGVACSIDVALQNMAEEMRTIQSLPNLGLALCSNTISRYIIDCKSGKLQSIENGKRIAATDKCANWIVIRGDTAEKVLAGSMSPITAIVNGRLRIVGDEEKILEVFSHLAQDRDAVINPCSQKL